MNYRLITFDVFSALGDIQGTFIPILNELPIFRNEDSTSFFAMWRAKQYEYMVVHNSLDRKFMSFEEITRRTLDYTLHVHQMNLPKDERERLVATWRQINFWPEARDIVEEVKRRGYLIGMLSNGDEDMLYGLAKKFGIDFDYIFSAEQIETYKPSPKMYQLPYDKTDIQHNEYMHVAGSTTDIFGAIASGIPCAWSNRKSEVTIDLSYKPTYNMNDLTDLLHIV